MKVKTDFLAEECLNFLKEKVEPAFPGIVFERYKPDKETAIIKYADRVLIVVDEKTVFKYELQGISLVDWHVIRSLKRYALEIHKENLIER